MEKLRAIVIEDTASIGTLYSGMLKQLDYEVAWYDTGHLGLSAAIENPPDVILLDLELPDLHGFEILERLNALDLDTEVVVITGHSSVDSALKSMRCGAADFLEKPFSQERLKATLENLMKSRRLSQELQALREKVQRDGYAGFVGSSLPMQVVYRIIDSAAASKATAFITGESGTGKELCAQAIHDKSDRAGGPFVAVNCGAIPRDLFESEIFGHVKGAFSGATSDREGAAERADGGTLFLDEIGEMDLDQQVKLLRFIQSGQIQRVGSNKTQNVDVRFVCATNRSPLKQVQEGTFREDLYYRLNVIPISMPSLRERGDDVLKIALSMLCHFADTEQKAFKGFAPDAERALLGYKWPGNVRQLSNVIHNIVLLNSGELVTQEMLPDPLGHPSTADDTHPTDHAGETNDSATELEHPLTALWKVEKKAIERAVEFCNGNIPVAAAHLGVSASTIYRKIKQWEEETNEE